MNNIKIFRVFGVLTLISLYFLILVGGIVRATGSGMGCPDWPKCFGHYIPPSDITEVTFKENHYYSKKVFIIHQEKLYFSKLAFTSKDVFDPQDWIVFEDHNYTEFNPLHTWIEAFNRYIGVFVGLFVLGLFVYSYLLYKRHHGIDTTYDYQSIMRYSLVALVFVVIQGIIGKYLVQSNLKLKMLTVHMLFSYTVLFTVIYVLYNTAKSFLEIKFDKSIFNLLVFVIVLTGVQTVLGTQVTANVEELLKQNVERAYLVRNFNIWFYIHRSFSIVLLLSNTYLIYKVFKIESNRHVRLVALLCLFALIAEALVGMTLNYLNYPKIAQPLHLLLGTVIAGGQIYLYIIYQKQKQRVIV